MYTNYVQYLCDLHEFQENFVERVNGYHDRGCMEGAISRNFSDGLHDACRAMRWSHMRRCSIGRKSSSKVSDAFFVCVAQIFWCFLFRRRSIRRATEG